VIKQFLKRRLKSLLTFVGINPALLRMRYWKERKQWLQQGGKITKLYPITCEYNEDAGKASGHYYHQDLLVASYIHQRKPPRHIDVGSFNIGFVAHLASFREVEVMDIRPLKPSIHQNIKFFQADLMQPYQQEITESLSCLHAIEHFGLGRYNDPIDVNGHIKGITNLIQMLKPQGILYISFPIGKKDEVHFNAHRVFHPLSLFDYPSVKQHLKLIKFDYVDDQGNLHLDGKTEDAVDKFIMGCGIYTFQKNLNSHAKRL